MKTMSDDFMPTNELRILKRNTEDGSTTITYLQQLWIRDKRVSNGTLLAIYMEEPYEKEWRDIPTIWE